MKRMVSSAVVAGLLAVAGPVPGVEAAVPGADRLSYTRIASYGGGGYADIQLGDVDEDGDPDIAVTLDNSFEVWENDGTGRFTPIGSYLTNPFGQFTWETNLADVDDDGRLDAVSNTSDTLFVRWGNGDGTFGTGFEQAAGGDDAEVVDFDGDGDLDIVLVSLFGQDVRVLRNQGNRTLVVVTYPTPGIEPRLLSTADLNADGRLDVAMTHAPYSSGNPPGTLALLSSQPAGGYAGSKVAPSVNSPGDVRTGDLDNDGLDDVVLFSGDEFYGDDSSDLYTYLGTGNGVAAPLRSPLTLRANAREVLLRDVNGDGNLDAIVTTLDRNFRVLEGFGDGTFDTERVFPTPDDTTDLAIGDVDGDGLPDVVVTSILDQFYVYRNTTVADTTAPQTAVTATPTVDGSNGWVRGPMTVAVSATDSGEGSTGVAEVRCVLDPPAVPPSFSAIPAGCTYTGAGAAVGADGTHAVFAASRDLKGNESEVVSVTFQIDATPPSVLRIDTDPAAPDGADGWFRTASVGLHPQALDATSGIDEVRCVVDPAVAPATFADLPADGCEPITTDGEHVVVAAALDVAGNVSTLASTVVRRDATAPTVAVATPAEGSLVQRGQMVRASYTCSDAASGVAACDGPVADGSPIDTTRTGAQTFTVTVRDVAGNTASVTHRYQVCGGIILGRCLEGSDQPPTPPRGKGR